MNLHLRLRWTLLRGRRMPAIVAGEAIERRLRVLPNASSSSARGRCVPRAA
jgi:hypothetical protein